MANKPRRSFSRIGLVVTALSSPDGTTELKKLGGRTDDMHWVRVRNIQGYPADLDCRGRINNRYKTIKFASPSAADSDIAWTDQRLALPDRTTHEFHHVGLLPASAHASGFENVEVEVEIDWPGTIHHDKVPLTIQVEP
jgi:hypothetical protein